MPSSAKRTHIYTHTHIPQHPCKQVGPSVCWFIVINHSLALTTLSPPFIVTLQSSQLSSFYSTPFSNTDFISLSIQEKPFCTGVSGRCHVQPRSNPMFNCCLSFIFDGVCLDRCFCIYSLSYHPCSPHICKLINCFYLLPGVFENFFIFSSASRWMLSTLSRAIDFSGSSFGLHRTKYGFSSTTTRC